MSGRPSETQGSTLYVYPMEGRDGVWSTVQGWPVQPVVPQLSRLLLHHGVDIVSVGVVHGPFRGSLSHRGLPRLKDEDGTGTPEITPLLLDPHLMLLSPVHPTPHTSEVTL